MMTMIDLHAHILPDVDDGPVDIEESLDMIRMGHEDGIDTICTTPHLLGKPSLDRMDIFRERFELLLERVQAAGLPVDLYLGAEIYFQQDMEIIRELPLLSLNGTGKYLLMEFPMQGIPPEADKTVFRLVMSGIIPIIAHPERNLSVLKDDDIMDIFVRAGALLQVNASSLEGRFGRRVKKCAISLLKKGLVHLIASDAHNATDRPIRLRAGVECASQIIGRRQAELLVSDHPRRILSGNPLPSGGLAPAAAAGGRLLQKVWRDITGR
jgi:protein-tyrosine phosphatase